MSNQRYKINTYESVFKELMTEKKDIFLAVVGTFTFEGNKERVGYLFGAQSAPILSYCRESAKEHSTFEDAKEMALNGLKKYEMEKMFIIRLSVDVDIRELK